jgi:prophage regulatory protein
MIQGEMFLRLPQVIQKVGMSRATIYKQMKKGFPKPVKIAGGYSSAWLASEIEAYMQAIVSEQRATHTN